MAVRPASAPRFSHSPCPACGREPDSPGARLPNVGDLPETRPLEDLGENPMNWWLQTIADGAQHGQSMRQGSARTKNPESGLFGAADSFGGDSSLVSKSLPESNPLRSRFLVCRLAVLAARLGAKSQMTRSAGKFAYQRNPHIGPSGTWDAGCWFAVPFAVASLNLQIHPFPGTEFSQKIRSPKQVCIYIYIIIYIYIYI